MLVAAYLSVYVGVFAPLVAYALLHSANPKAWFYPMVWACFISIPLSALGIAAIVRRQNPVWLRGVISLLTASNIYCAYLALVPWVR